MPTIPTYRQQTSVSGAATGVGSVPKGAGLQHLGAALQSANQDILSGRAIIAAKKEEQAQVAANTELMSARSEWLTKLQARKQEAPAGAAGFTDTLLAEFDTDLDARVERAATPQAKQYLRQQLAQVRLGLQQDAMTFEAGSIVDHKTGQLRQSVDAARTAVEFRPQDFDTVAAEQGRAILSSGLPAKIQEGMTEDALDALSASAVSGMIRANPYRALVELNNERSQNTAIRALSFDDRQRLRAAAEAEIRSREVEARDARSRLRTDLNSRVEDARAAYLHGMDVENPPTRADFLSAYPPEQAKDADRDYNAFAAIQRIGADLKVAARLPPEEQQALLDARLYGARPAVEATALGEADEQRYREWMTRIGHTREKGFAVGSDFTGSNYDYRGFFKKYGAVDVAEGQHLTDEFKLPSHPTFSVESRYAVGDAKKFAGRWDGETFVPPEGTARAEGAADQFAAYDILASHIANLNRQLEADPAAYVVTYDPATRAAAGAMSQQMTPQTVDAYATASLSAQVTHGVTAPKLLTEGQAQQMGERLKLTGNGSDVVEAINAERTMWGRHWPRALSEASPKLNPVVQVIALETPITGNAAGPVLSMDPVPAARLATVAAMPKEELGKLMPDGVRMADLETEVQADLADFAQTLIGAAGAESQLVQISDAATKLAASYVAGGASMSEAAERAANEVLLSRYTVGEFGGSLVRFPIGVDSDLALQGLRGVARQIIDVLQTDYDEVAWRTLPDDTGVLLVDRATGRPVAQEDGTPYLLSFSQLMQFGVNNREEVRRITSESMKGIGTAP